MLSNQGLVPQHGLEQGSALDVVAGYQLVDPAGVPSGHEEGWVTVCKASYSSQGVSSGVRLLEAGGGGRRLD